MKLDKIDWVILTSSVILTTYLVWILMDDPVNRRLVVLHRLSRACKSIAYDFGQAGIALELEYYRVLEQGRM